MGAMSSTSLHRSVFACGYVALLTLLSLRAAAAEGISASASTTPQIPPRHRCAAPANRGVGEARPELEKPKVDDVKDDSAQEAAAKKLEQRLANLENGINDRPDTPLTVTAPFIVVDGKGKPIMWVGEAGEKEGQGGFARGMYIHNATGLSVAHVGALAEGTGRIYVTSAAAPPTVAMYVDRQSSVARSFMRDEGHTVFELL